MHKGETKFDGIFFAIKTVLKMVTPPIYSLGRLEKYYKSQIKKNPQAYSPRISLAQLYRDHKRYEDALMQLDELKRLDYMTDSAWITYGVVLYRLDDYQGAIDSLAPILDKNSLAPVIKKLLRYQRVNWYLGRSYIKKEEYQKALTCFEREVKSGYKGYEVFWNLGFCYSNIGQFEKAKDAYSKALALKPNSNELKDNLALAHIRLGQSLLDTDLIQAEAEIRKALDVFPEHPEAIEKLKDVQEIRRLRVKITELKASLKRESDEK